MDYKKVIEEQIETLQKFQKEVARPDIACHIAETISRLIDQARRL